MTQVTSPPESEPIEHVRDRSWLAQIWYEIVRRTVSVILVALCHFRATGRRHIPLEGGVLIVSNHLSHLDVFAIGIPTPRPLNYVARSTLFVPVLGPLIRSVGGFPIQREGMGASGVKETLRRIRRGGMVLLFPEGTRSRDGRLAEIKSGIAALALRAKVPIVPAGIAGTFEGWPRTRPFPLPHPIRIVFGPPIPPEEIASQTVDSLTLLIQQRMLDCQREALRTLARDLGIEPGGGASMRDDSAPGGKSPLGSSSDFD